MHKLRLWVLAAALLTSGAAQAAEAYLTNDHFTGGSVNAGVSFGEYEGAGVLLEDDPANYPLEIDAVDVLCASATTPGAQGAYIVDIWGEQGGTFVEPPSTNVGNLYSGTWGLTASATQMTRIPISPPITVSSGKIFIAVREQLSTADDDTTIALDNSPSTPGGNWYYYVLGGFVAFGTDGGPPTPPNGNWIIRAVINVPGAPDAGGSSTATSSSSTGSTGTTASGTSTGSTGAASTGSTASSAGATGTSGSGSAGTTSSATSLASSSGTGTTGSSTSSSGSTGTTGAQLSLVSISPTQMVNTEDTVVVLTGTGFQSDTQALIGPQLLINPDIKSAAVIQGTVSKGTAPGTYDVVVINSSGQRATLSKAFTVTQGSSAGTKAKGCGCTSGDLSGVLGLLGSMLFLGRASRRRL